MNICISSVSQKILGAGFRGHSNLILIAQFRQSWKAADITGGTCF